MVVATILEVEAFFDPKEEHLDDLMVEGLFVACRLVVDHSMEVVVSGRANHQRLEDVREVDLYFLRSQVVEDRLILVGLLEEVVRANLRVAHLLLLFFEPMLQFLTKLPTLRHRQYWMKYLDLFAKPLTSSSKC